MKDTLFERLLKFYNITEDDFKELSKDYNLNNFIGNHHFDDIENASILVKKAIEKQSKIIVYGDYDADGVMATSILVKAFKKLNYDVGYYLPSRYLDGYGINTLKAKEIIDKKYDLVITVDNGINAFEPIKMLKDAGIDVIVIDHHTPSEEKVDASYIIHPSVSNFGLTPTSAGFVSFIFSYYLLGEFDPYLSILGAISVVSDMMPLKSYNRRLLKAVFSYYTEGKYSPIDALKDDDKFDENCIGMKIAPRINAVGRIVKDASINHLVTYFVSEDKDIIFKLSEWIKNKNEERKEISKRDILYLKDKIDESESAIILKSDIDEGLLGLAANNFVREYNRPIIIFTKDSNIEGALKGSARAIKSFNVVEAFASLSSYILTSGGHALAGGLSIKEEDFLDFKNAFIEYTKKKKIEVVKEETIDLGITELSLENYYLVQKFAPFGEEWPAPTFKVNHIKTSTLTYSKNGLHILSNLGFRTRLVGFGFSKEYVSQFDFINIYGSMRLSYFRGIQNLEFVIKEIDNYDE